jgi:hypothetical protein
MQCNGIATDAQPAAKNLQNGNGRCPVIGRGVLECDSRDICPRYAPPRREETDHRPPAGKASIPRVHDGRMTPMFHAVKLLLSRATVQD